MTWDEPRIADSTYYRHTCFHYFFNQLAKRIVQVGLFEISARGDVDDANSVLIFVPVNPTQSRFDIAFRNTPGLPDLDEHNVRFRSNASVKTIREMAVSGGNDGSHHAMPTGDVGRFQK